MSEFLDIVEGLARTGRAIYLGSNHEGPQFARCTESATVLGAPRTGKSSAIISPSVAAHPGPVVVTSVRTSSGDHPDVRDTTLPSRLEVARRFGGRVMELVIDDRLPTRAERVWWDITHGCDEWDTAIERGHALAQAAIPASERDAKFWRLYVGNIVAAAFYAAAWSEPPMSDRDVAKRLSRRDLSDFTAILSQYDHPSADILSAFEEDHPETRSGAEMILRSQLLGQFRFDAPPVDDYLDLDAFLRSHGTLYITLRLERAQFAAPLLASLLRSMMAQWPTILRSQRAPSLLLALDEVANVAPVGDLPKIVSAGGGDGVQCLLGLQSLSQAKEHWGLEYPVIVSGTTHQVIIPGFKDTAFLNDVVALVPKTMQYDSKIRVSEHTTKGEGFARQDRLIRERQTIENARQDARPRLERLAEQQAARIIRLERLRQGVRTRPGFNTNSSGVRDEIFASTTSEEVAERRSVVEASDLFSAGKGLVFVLSGSLGRFLKAPGWYDDLAWRDVIVPES